MGIYDDGDDSEDLISGYSSQNMFENSDSLNIFGGSESQSMFGDFDSQSIFGDFDSNIFGNNDAPSDTPLNGGTNYFADDHTEEEPSSTFGGSAFTKQTWGAKKEDGGLMSTYQGLGPAFKTHLRNDLATSDANNLDTAFIDSLFDSDDSPIDEIIGRRIDIVSKAKMGYFNTSTHGIVATSMLMNRLGAGSLGTSRFQGKGAEADEAFGEINSFDDADWTQLDSMRDFENDAWGDTDPFGGADNKIEINSAGNLFAGPSVKNEQHGSGAILADEPKGIADRDGADWTSEKNWIEAAVGGEEVDNMTADGARVVAGGAVFKSAAEKLSEQIQKRKPAAISGESPAEKLARQMRENSNSQNRGAISPAEKHKKIISSGKTELGQKGFEHIAQESKTLHDEDTLSSENSGIARKAVEGEDMMKATKERSLELIKKLESMTGGDLAQIQTKLESSQNPTQKEKDLLFAIAHELRLRNFQSE